MDSPFFKITEKNEGQASNRLAFTVKLQYEK